MRRLMSCCICQKSKVTLVCGICKGDLCKSCTEFLEPEQFSFFSQVPENLSHSAYCSDCYTVKVAPEQSHYDELMEQAKQVSVYEKTQHKETRLVKRNKDDEVKITDWPDYKDALLRLAFFAAEKGFNTLVDVDLKAKKIINGRYQSSLWSGTALPANMTEKDIVKDRSLRSSPN